MALLLDQIEWSDPILPTVSDPAWEAQVKQRVGSLRELDRLVAASPWLREACVGFGRYQPGHISQRLFNIGCMVTAQENACRYCYGSTRAYMKILGYSESFIRRIERDANLAELDPGERAFIAFCRNLARARPRPARAELEKLMKLGFSSTMVHESAFLIASNCFYNRIGILTASPPEESFERMANGPLGRVIGTAAALLRPLTTLRGRKSTPAMETAGQAGGPFGRLVAALPDLPAATAVRTALDGAFESTVLSRAAKSLMFAVVARSLACKYSETEALALLESDGFDAAEADATIAMLSSARLTPAEARLLPWVRDTVHYQTGSIQKQTRALTADIGSAAGLEAIGIAALANSTVRLAMLLE